MLPQFNRAQHFLKYCNHGNPMLLRFAAAQRCDLDTWRTLTFSLCKTVNCVCSQTARQTQAGRRRVQRFELWNVTVQARRTKPTKQSWVEPITLRPPVSFLMQTHLTGFFIFYYPSSLWLLFSSRSGWLTSRFSPHPDRCDKLTYQSLTLADSSLWPVPAGKEGERCDPRIGPSVTDPQQLLAAHTELRLLFWSLKTLLRTAGPATHCSTYLCRAAWKREQGSSHSFPLEMCEAAFWLQAQNIFFISSVMDSFHCDLMLVTSITLQNSYSESDKKINLIKICSTGIKHKTLKKHKHSSFNQWERALKPTVFEVNPV